MSSPKALVILADGSEEMEAVIVIDVLRRAHINVLVAGLQSAESIRCSRNVVIKPDTSLADALDRAALFDVIVLPGGADGATAFAESAKVGEALSEQERRGSLIAAICAAPIALQRHKIALGRQLTSHPSKATQLRGILSWFKRGNAFRRKIAKI